MDKESIFILIITAIFLLNVVMWLSCLVAVITNYVYHSIRTDEEYTLL